MCYGEEIDFSIKLLKFKDKKLIQKFDCGNDSLNSYIKLEIFDEDSLNTDDGLHFKVVNNTTKDIIGFFSLAASGVYEKCDNYIKVHPAIKIDVFAIDKRFQKLHFDKNSEQSTLDTDKFYFSDLILTEVVKKIRYINENHASVDFIILYSAKNKVHFYKRNLFLEFTEYMKNEFNTEISNNIPMYMEL